MTGQNMYNAGQVAKILDITEFTLSNWYNWENKQVKNGLSDKNPLPQPIKLEHAKGKPRMWTSEMIVQLKEYKKGIVIGRNGKFGAYSNPSHKQTKKYLKQQEEQHENS